MQTLTRLPLVSKQSSRSSPSAVAPPLALMVPVDRDILHRRNAIA